MTKPDQDGPDVAGLLPLLADLPSPQMPAEVAARLDAAIARAVAERVDAGGRGAVKAPQRASQSPWRRRLRTLAMASGAACLLLCVGLLVSLVVRGSGSDSGSSGTASAGGPPVAALSTAPVTDPSLLSWAAAALQGRPAHNGQVVRPGFSTFATPGAQTTPTGSTSSASSAAACLSAAPLFQPAMEQRQLLSSASGDYNGQPAILLVYSNGSDASTAYIVVFAAPCHESASVVLSSGVVPR